MADNVRNKIDEYIPIDRNIRTKPFFMRLRRKTKFKDTTLIGCLNLVWFEAHRALRIGFDAIVRADLDWVDDLVDEDGFGKAMADPDVGLLRLEQDENGSYLVFPDYFRRNKRAATPAERQAAKRARDAQQNESRDVTDERDKCDSKQQEPSQNDVTECDKRDKTLCDEANVTDVTDVTDVTTPDQTRPDQTRQEFLEGRSGEDHRCKGGECEGGREPRRADGATAPKEPHDGAEDSTAARVGQTARESRPDAMLDPRVVLATASELFGEEAGKRGGIAITKLDGFDHGMDRPTLLKIAACRVAGTVSEDWVVDAVNGLKNRLEKTDMPKLNQPVNYLCKILKESAPGKLGNRTYQQVLAQIDPRIPWDQLNKPKPQPNPP
jgi:hypothetical protein